MPNRRITIILNANQTKRITVLVPLPQPDDVDVYNVRDHILLQARNKFHNKYLYIVYRRGGAELEDFASLPDEEDEVLVSKGESYIGPPNKKLRADGIVAESSVIAHQSFVHEDAVKQMEALKSLQGVYSVVGMPDLHKGDRFPIGCAIFAQGIYPALIGSDIGCGISLYPLGATPAHLTPQKLASKLLKGRLDEPWEGDAKRWLSIYGIKGDEEDEFDSSLGTVGGGNHFAEIVSVERIVDQEACDSMGVYEGRLYVLVHTGSRGLGASILRDYTRSNANPYLIEEEERRVYLARHDHAVLWARANRDLVAHRIKACIFGGRGSDSDEQGEDEKEAKDTAEPNYKDYLSELEKILDVTHNSVTLTGYEHDGAFVDAYLHRKGAAPADRGFVPCPGSRGDFSWIVQPMGDGKQNAYSLPHGAGRLHPRNAPSLRRGTADQLRTTALDSYVVCTDPDLLVQERPEAYKSVQAVIDDVEEAGVAEGVVVLRPYVTFKTAVERRK
ncbi:SubName: Full=Uncharacterized protein {ECO:0000313/EMBL:CCA69767.1} [Serendipita indica DSM 11827]|nr:SubName: Full=Uncharacterized protein {ECO:0000313/EMBL:CCA69767.1} [Serendipita indica DSM 11827]